MKYGELLETQSVPRWSLHNVDYNALKHHIKAHTTRDQAAGAARAIPGRPADAALARFEDDFYAELCRQHDRVHLFVVSKADEIGRRLQHISDQIHRLVVRCAQGPSDEVPPKTQRRFAKYEGDVLDCEDDVAALARFRNAQVVAFRKILKKYKKWTGSTSLGARFRDSLLNDPKGFSRLDFQHLQTRCEEVLATVREAAPSPTGKSRSSAGSETNSRSTQERTPRRQYSQLPEQAQIAVVAKPAQTSQESSYWNEYDNGSEAGGDYVLYVNADETSFPGLGRLLAVMNMPVDKFRAWMSAHGSTGDRSPLLPTNGELRYGTVPRQCSSTGSTTEEDEARSVSTDGLPSEGYATHYAALPSVEEQRIAAFRERVLLRGMLACFTTAAALIILAAVLMTTGRRRLRTEVDAGVVVGVVVSLCCDFLALTMMLSRRSPLSIWHRLAVWQVFSVICVLNGALLVLVARNTAL